MLTSHERAALIDKIRVLPTQIEHLVGTLSLAELSGHFLPGEWSAAQNVHHLADSHMNSYIRCRLILTEEEPTLKPYDQNRWAALPDAEAVDVTPSLQLLHGLHARWVAFFEHLPDEAWQRPGFHPENGLVTLEDQLVLYAAHGEGHIEQMRRTVAAQYAAPPATLEELLARIDREWERLGGLLSRIPRSRWEAPLPGAAGDWSSPRDQMAHITAWERYLLEGVIAGQPPRATVERLVGQRIAGLDIDAQNELLLQVSAGKSLNQVVDEFQAIHAQVRAAVAAIDFAEWAARTPEQDGRRQHTLHSIAEPTYSHYLEHWQWLPIVC